MREKIIYTHQKWRNTLYFNLLLVILTPDLGTGRKVQKVAKTTVDFPEKSLAIRLYID